MYYNQAPPHQGIGQRLHQPPRLKVLAPHNTGEVIAVPLLGGLHPAYRWVTQSTATELECRQTRQVAR